MIAVLWLYIIHYFRYFLDFGFGNIYYLNILFYISQIKEVVPIGDKGNLIKIDGLVNFLKKYYIIYFDILLFNSPIIFSNVIVYVICAY